MSKQKIFLLDAMALLYRAHFAFIKNPRITSSGINTSAVFGFTNTLLEIINKENPTHLGVAFDTNKPTFRHVQFESYKGHREEMPEDLQQGIPYAYKLLKVLKIPALVLDGFEADDIIGTIAHKVPEDAYEVYMVTPDKDYAQLVKDNVFLYKPQHKGGGFDVLGPKEIEEKFGLPPEQITDFLGLKGDASDNIPGIPKIGDKTAISLLKEYGSVENLIAHAEEVSKKSVKESILQHKDQGILSKELATIHVDVPIKWTVDDLKLEPCDLEELQALMQELEFRTTAQRILNTRLNPMHIANGGTLGTGQVELNLTGDDVKTLENTEQQYHFLDTPAKRQPLVQRILKEKQVCFDTETTSIDAMQAELVGISFALKAKEAFYIPVPDDRDAALQILAEFREVWEGREILKIGQNLKYDLLVLRNYDVKVRGPFFDTMLAHYIDLPSGKHGMDAMAKELLNYEPISIETLIGKKGKDQKSMREVDPTLVKDYAAEDADITYRLYEVLREKVRDNKVFEEIEQPLLPVLADMEFEGIRLDEQALEDYSIELGERLLVLEKEIYRLAGEVFNINSPKQLGEILFDKLELGKGKKAKKTRTGQYATNEQILMDLAVKHELPAQVLAYRGLTKLKSTYVDALPKLVNPRSGRVHTTYSQTVAVTGRLSSVNPNLQNIPIRTQDGREVRKGFIPRDEDHLLLSADYSQVELRIMAAMSKDPAMMEAFQSGADIHRASAARVFHVAPEAVTLEQRSRAKTVNFGIIYGISAFGLSQRMGISRGEAKDIIDTYFETYPHVKAYMDHSIEFARTHGYVETWFGRRRYLPDIHSRNATVRSIAERNAINSPIQGTAADIIKLAMIQIFEAFDQAQLRSKMLLQVHDELVFEVYKPELEQVKAIVSDKMVHAVDMEVPMAIEMGTGNNWLEAH